LGFRGVVGESLAYLAEAGGEWLAVLWWAAAALKYRPRDEWVGWHPAVAWQRLHLVANNVRFLILPGVRVPNLASRVLGVCAKRLSADWQQAWGHPILLVETFIDPERFSGTCYRAAGWLRLGETRGYARRCGGWEHHGHPKVVLVKELQRGARQVLMDPQPNRELTGGTAKMKLEAKHIESLFEVLNRVADPRQRRGLRHHKKSLLAISVTAVVCGARSFDAIAQWARQCTQAERRRLRCRRNPHTGQLDVPSEPTLRRFLQNVDAEAVDAAIGPWLATLCLRDAKAVALDGKTLRGARRSDQSQVHLLSLVVQSSGITIAQREVESHTNEIPIAPRLLSPIPLEGKCVTADALHTQQQLARYVVEEKKAHYCFTVKDNQPELKKDINTLFDEKRGFPPQYETAEKAHGRFEVRRIWTSTELNEYVKFPYCGQVAHIERITTVLSTGKIRQEQVAIITSLSPEQATPAQLLELVRGQWSIENKSHWVRDVTFDEDRSQVRTKQAPRMMAILRNLAIAIVRLLGLGYLPEGLRYFAQRPRLALNALGL
jgi:predicted transposase YbfD/YdcC